MNDKNNDIEEQDIEATDDTPVEKKDEKSSEEETHEDFESPVQTGNDNK